MITKNYHQMTDKDITKQYWREFEKLSVELISKEFNVEPTIVYVTRGSQDGGYDGKIVHRVFDSKETKIDFVSLLESKLYSKSVSLRSFATTMIVAHNTRAHILFIVSNQLFTKQAIQEAAQFMQTSRLEVHLINGPTVSGYVRKYYQQLLERYSDELLHFLLEDNLALEKVCNDEITIQLNDHRKTEAVVEYGWNKDGTIADCKLRLNHDLRNSSSVVEIIGAQRIDIMDRLYDALWHPGISVLRGEAGVGKSIIIEQILYRLNNKGWLWTVLDLGQIRTSRSLFLEILSATVGIKFANIVVEGARSMDELIEALTFSPTHPIPRHLGEAVAHILMDDSNFASTHSDINAALFLQYLQATLGQHQSQPNHILIFQNLNRGSPETLDFLAVALDILDHCGVTVLIELRGYGEAEAHTPDEWRKRETQFRRKATRFDKRVHALTKNDAVSFISKALPGMGENRAEVIVERVGRVPLYLESACAWLREQQVVSSRTGETYTIQQLQTFFEDISPDNCIVLIDRHISFWMKHENPNYCYAIIAASLLDGRLTIPALETIIVEDDHTDFADTLLPTGLFTLNQHGGLSLKVKHDLMLERMRILSEESPFKRIEIAQKIVPKIDKVVIDPLRAEMLRANLAFICGEFKLSHEASTIAGNELKALGQLSDSAKMFELAIKSIEKMPAIQVVRKEFLVESLFTYLCIENDRNRLQLNENSGYLAQLETLIILEPILENREKWQLLIDMLRWRKHFLKEEFSQALPLALSASENAKNMNEKLPKTVSGEAFSNLGLTYKALGEIEKAQNAFVSATKTFPDCAICKVEYLSFLGAQKLVTDPLGSLSLLRDMIKVASEADNFPFREIIHLKVDVSMANFLAKQYGSAFELAMTALSEAEANAFPTQVARARNILACCFWIRNELDMASKQLDLAIFAAERSYYYRFLWRMRTNMAAVSAETGNASVALENALLATDLILGPREGVQMAPLFTDSDRKNRRYAALLSITHTLNLIDKKNIIEQMIERVASPIFAEDSRIILDGEFPKKVLDGTTHIHAGHIMITG